LSRGTVSGGAAALATSLLSPSVLDEALRSGVFFVRPLADSAWDTWKAEFIHWAGQGGSIVICVDAARGAGEARVEFLLALNHAQQPHGRVTGDESIAARARRLVAARRGNLVVLMEEVDGLLNDDGEALLRALKAARDTVNLSAASGGSFILVAAGRDVSVVQRLVSESDKAFFGASFGFEPVGVGPK
jgi:hypothetical protein